MAPANGLEQVQEGDVVFQNFHKIKKAQNFKISCSLKSLVRPQDWSHFLYLNILGLGSFYFLVLITSTILFSIFFNALHYFSRGPGLILGLVVFSIFF